MPRRFVMKGLPAPYKPVFQTSEAVELLSPGHLPGHGQALVHRENTCFTAVIILIFAHL